MTAKAPASPREMLAHLSKKATYECDKKTGLVKLHADRLTKQTKTAAERAKVEKGLTPKEKKMTDFLKKEPFGCNNDVAIKFAGIIFGKSLPVDALPNKSDDDGNDGPTIDDHKIPRFTMLVPLKNPNSHDYEIGKPALVINAEDEDPFDDLLKVNGHTGNSMNDRQLGVRLATNEEIDAFFAKVPTAALKKHFDTAVEVIETTMGKKLTGGSRLTKKKGTKKKTVKKPKKKSPRKKSPKKKAARKKGRKR